MGAEADARDSDVVVDVEFDEGLLFLVLANLGDGAAHRIRVKFDEPLRGLGGERRIDRLRIFRRLEFLPPHRRIRILLDRSALYFAREETTAFGVSISWRDDAGRGRSRAIRHELDVYRDFPYLEVPRDAR
jgi:hypothetical protein